MKQVVLPKIENNGLLEQIKSKILSIPFNHKVKFGPNVTRPIKSPAPTAATTPTPTTTRAAATAQKPSSLGSLFSRMPLTGPMPGMPIITEAEASRATPEPPPAVALPEAALPESQPAPAASHTITDEEALTTPPAPVTAEDLLAGPETSVFHEDDDRTRRGDSSVELAGFDSDILSSDSSAPLHRLEVAEGLRDADWDVILAAFSASRQAAATSTPAPELVTIAPPLRITVSPAKPQLEPTALGRKTTLEQAIPSKAADPQAEEVIYHFFDVTLNSSSDTRLEANFWDFADADLASTSVDFCEKLAQNMKDKTLIFSSEQWQDGSVYSFLHKLREQLPYIGAHGYSAMLAEKTPAQELQDDKYNLFMDDKTQSMSIVRTGWQQQEDQETRNNIIEISSAADIYRLSMFATCAYIDQQHNLTSIRNMPRGKALLIAPKNDQDLDALIESLQALEKAANQINRKIHVIGLQSHSFNPSTSSLNQHRCNELNKLLNDVFVSAQEPSTKPAPVAPPREPHFVTVARSQVTTVTPPATATLPKTPQGYTILGSGMHKIENGKIKAGFLSLESEMNDFSAGGKSSYQVIVNTVKSSLVVERHPLGRITSARGLSVSALLANGETVEIPIDGKDCMLVFDVRGLGGDLRNWRSNAEDQKAAAVIPRQSLFVLNRIIDPDGSKGFTASDLLTQYEGQPIEQFTLLFKEPAS